MKSDLYMVTVGALLSGRGFGVYYIQYLFIMTPIPKLEALNPENPSPNKKEKGRSHLRVSGFRGRCVAISKVPDFAGFGFRILVPVARKARLFGLRTPGPSKYPQIEVKGPKFRVFRDK